MVTLKSLAERQTESYGESLLNGLEFATNLPLPLVPREL